ncbi:UvrD-helicase domain-containing protein [Microbacterium gorillae]|uniref:UvrD-helicase domain-containing protein n=1 Tax=Microbacterium gorillae TaxID=1231063 RepID=UPI003D97244E
MPDYPPTPEQHRSIELYLTGQNLVIEALAGTGKTSTLQFIAEVSPHRRGLYAAFNKSVQQDAQRRFARTTVTSKTVHALAFAAFGHPMQHRLNNKRPVMWADKAKILGINDKYMFAPTDGARTAALSRQQLVKHATETVNLFLKSAGEDLTAEMVLIPPELGTLKPAAASRLQDTILGFARRYWEDLQNPHGGLRYTADAYLKQWQLSQPMLPYDFILFDEAQDADALMVDVLRRQTNTQIVAVGDRNQAIYGWRGAEDAMDAFGGVHTALTMSFRFGQEIADVANEWLDMLGTNPAMRVQGLPGKPASVWNSERVPEAVLTRTNGGALQEAVESQMSGTPTGIAGERKARELRDLAQAAHDLQEKRWTKHPELDSFNTWGEVVAYAESEDGSDLKPLVDIVEKVGAREVVRVIDSCVPTDQARTVVSTAHVAKGLEWKQVRISDDFRDPGDRRGVPKPLPAEEARLAYVAVTRAFRHLDRRGFDWVPDYLARGGWVEGNAAHVDDDTSILAEAS